MTLNLLHDSKHCEDEEGVGKKEEKESQELEIRKKKVKDSEQKDGSEGVGKKVQSQVLAKML